MSSFLVNVVVGSLPSRWERAQSDFGFNGLDETSARLARRLHLVDCIRRMPRPVRRGLARKRSDWATTSILPPAWSVERSLERPGPTVMAARSIAEGRREGKGCLSCCISRAAGGRVDGPNVTVVLAGPGESPPVEPPRSVAGGADPGRRPGRASGRCRCDAAAVPASSPPPPRGPRPQPPPWQGHRARRGTRLEGFSRFAELD